MKNLTPLLFLFACLVLASCNKKADNSTALERQQIEMTTDKGKMLIELYNETPKHRDNFIKLAKEGVFDSLMFHRVIENFMVQGGDPESKNALATDTIGNGGLDYMVDAEFSPDLFHKKGVLAAARNNNPERASNASQFYLVQGKVFNDSLLLIAENRINEWLAEHYAFKDPENKELVEAREQAKEKNDTIQFTQLNDSLNKLFKDYTNFEKYTIPEAHRQVYKTLGGTPHLDQNYTVFGEVIEGIEIIDSIAKVPTGVFNRPQKDVRILTVKVQE